MRNDRNNLIVEKVIQFALLSIEYCHELEEQKMFVISRQLLRSSTSIGANVFEAQNAESKADFVHKMKVAAKEASETLFWLILCDRSDRIQFDRKLRNELDEILRILSKIISTAKASF